MCCRLYCVGGTSDFIQQQHIQFGKEMKYELQKKHAVISKVI